MASIRKSSKASDLAHKHVVFSQPKDLVDEFELVEREEAEGADELKEQMLQEEDEAEKA